MDRFARAFVSVLLLAAVGLGAGCGGGTGPDKFGQDKFWEEMANRGSQ